MSRHITILQYNMTYQKGSTEALPFPEEFSCPMASAPPSLPRRITHPSLPKGKELVTQNIVISPHLASPVGEGQLLLLIY